MSVPASRDEARERIQRLVTSFRHNSAEFIRGGTAYNETQARTEFISPLLEALGWDVYNDKEQPLDLREVIEEATVEVGVEKQSKKPDYELRLARQRKLFVEAKKPSVRIGRDRDAAFQTRRYGFSASLPISVLTNFHEIAIYDCVPAPRIEDDAHVARIGLFAFEELEARFDELYDQLSRESVYSGAFDARFRVGVTRHGTAQFDDHFLEQVRQWRERLAADIHHNNPELTSERLTYFVQMFISRLVFLRICEDRDIERYEMLKGVGAEATFDRLMELLRHADQFYNSGLFRILEDDRLGVRISNDVLYAIIIELYYPESPYTFSVVEANVLGEIYELFLGQVISIDAAGAVEIVEKEEVRESGGVVPTPSFIVDTIVDRTLTPKISGRSPRELEPLRVADICCGSGVFLLSSFQRLLNYYLDWYQANERPAHIGTKIYEVTGGKWRLTLAEKRRILQQHLRGVDIDANAIEVARFSLLVKLIEDETAEGLASFAHETGGAVLPSLEDTIRCGNSLVAHDEYAQHNMVPTAGVTAKLNLFTWLREFPADMTAGGFDVIVGNPPYIRIQHMVHYSPEEMEFYQSDSSPYATAESNNFDKYALFLERSMSLLNGNGRLGLIIPNKFMTLTAGKALRKLLAEGRHLSQIVHFGAQQVFGARSSNYTCIVVLEKHPQERFSFEKVNDLARWRYGQHGDIAVLPEAQLSEGPWTFAAGSAEAAFQRMRATHPDRLSAVADIFVGVQTSADDIYLVEPAAQDDASVTFEWNGREWQLEKAILRPFLHDVTLAAYEKPSPNKFIIFPYRINGERANLIQPDEFQANYPGVWAYLSARRDELAPRNVQGGVAAEKQWYQYGRSQSLAKFNSAKIILPILSLEARYAFDDSNIVVTGGGNGPYYLVRPAVGSACSLYYLLAVLCHPLSEAMVRSRTSVFRGGYYSHGKQFIEVLPVPRANDADRREIDVHVARLIQVRAYAKAAVLRREQLLKEREADDLRDRVERLVTAAFGLSPDELTAIQAVPIPG